MNPSMTSEAPAELLACPFCGGPARVQENGVEPRLYWEVACDGDCDFVGPGLVTKAEVIAHWNTRASSAVSEEAEPVAWRYRHVPYVRWSYSEDKHPPRDGIEQEPLYLSPVHPEVGEPGTIQTESMAELLLVSFISHLANGADIRAAALSAMEDYSLDEEPVPPVRPAEAGETKASHITADQQAYDLGYDNPSLLDWFQWRHIVLANAYRSGQMDRQNQQPRNAGYDRDQYDPETFERREWRRSHEPAEKPMYISQDVAAAHAQFGGDLRDMQRRYDESIARAAKRQVDRNGS